VVNVDIKMADLQCPKCEGSIHYVAVGFGECNKCKQTYWLPE